MFLAFIGVFLCYSSHFETSRQKLNRTKQKLSFLFSRNTFDYVVQHIEIVQTVCYSATYFHWKSRGSTVVLQSLNTCVSALPCSTKPGWRPWCVTWRLCAASKSLPILTRPKKCEYRSKHKLTFIWDCSQSFFPIFGQSIIYFSDSGEKKIKM